jgi:DNA processing protein
MEQDYIRQAAIVMASLELLPAQPSDLTGILRDSDQFHALVDLNTQCYGTDLVGYLRENLEAARIEHWHKQLDKLIVNEVASPVLAADVPRMPRYPKRLATCWDAPPILFASTAIREDQPSVAIIGSRAAERSTLAETHALAGDLATSGVTIVSGLAAGVDAAAHEGALAVHGYTIAVLGTGITRVYPEQNTDLAHRIRANGTLVSQFAPYAPRTRTSFLRRNHVIAGLSDISIIMTGQSRSGSRHEIEQAMGYGRTVLMWEPALAEEKWAHQLAKSGRAQFVSHSNDIHKALDRIHS